MKIPNEMTERKLEKCLDEFYSSINKALDKACPKKKPRVKDKNNPWWSLYLQKYRKQINKLYRNRKKSTEQWDAYKKEEKKYRNLCSKAKRADWKYMVETQNSTESIKKLRKILEINAKNTLGILNKGDGTVTEPGTDTLKFLLSTHFPAVTETLETEYTEYKISTETVHELQETWLTTTQLRKVFNIFKNKKSPGPDGLRPIVLKQLTENKLSELIFLYKATLLLSFTPTQWKESLVIWIPKPHKESYKSP